VSQNWQKRHRRKLQHTRSNLPDSRAAWSGRRRQSVGGNLAFKPGVSSLSSMANCDRLYRVGSTAGAAACHTTVGPLPVSSVTWSSHVPSNLQSADEQVMHMSCLAVARARLLHLQYIGKPWTASHLYSGGTFQPFGEESRRQPCLNP
jgi:hypothetical protein